MNFTALVQAIAEIHRRTHVTATKAVNVALTLRNWLIGADIHEYELSGKDRATTEGQSPLALEIVRSLTGQSTPSEGAETVIRSAIDDPIKRAFYEVECARGN